MKLIRFGEKGIEKPGVLIDDQRWDCSAHFEDWNRSFFQNNGLLKLQELISKAAAFPLIEAEQRWGPPIARPGMIMCVGLNYSDHAAEAGMQMPLEPILFMKATNTLSGPYDDVPIPRGSSKTDWEVELGIVLNRDLLYLDHESEAWDAIAGFCVVHDVSERAFQIERGGQWVKGKSAPGFSPVGPYLVTKDEIDDVHNLQMQLYRNGNLMQNGNTKTMIFQSAFLVHYISQFMTLEAGDLITTGTPPGVGLGMKPPQYIEDGDIIELSIEQLGTQKQIFRAFQSNTNV
ncbi:MAG: fumarylacetoacetate hydrolase family protein [Saprospiraceae bacterium]